MKENTRTFDELQGYHLARLAADLRDFLDDLDLKVGCDLVLLALGN